MNVILPALVVGQWSITYVIISETPPLGIDARRWRWGCFTLIILIPYCVLLGIFLTSKSMAAGPVFCSPFSCGAMTHGLPG